MPSMSPAGIFLLSPTAIAFALLVASISWVTLRYALSLLSNIRYARSTGLKYIIYPVCPDTLLPAFLLSLPRVHSLIRLLPTEWQDYVWMGSYSTHWWLKDRMALRYGDVFLVVSPGLLCCVVSNADAITEILGNRERFPKPLENYESLSMYGPSIFTTEGEQFVHHRRYVAPTFGERNHALVWKTGLQQAMELVEFWQATSAGEGDSAVQPPVHHDLLSLTLHTVAGAAYGVPMTFLHREAAPDSLNGEEDLFSDGATPPTGFTLSFRQALAFVANNLIAHTIVSALPPWISRLKIPFVLQHRHAHTDFTRYLSALAATAGTSGRPTLLDLLVAGQDSEDDGKKLSREELMGNLFTFTLAGYETTAQTLYYALLMLALQPDTQRWVREGVDAALMDQPADPCEWRYETVFPLLVRPLCLMLETLRLFNIIPFVPKSTGASGTTLTIASKPVFLPPMFIIASATAVQRSRQHYGASAAEFSPERWDASNESSYLAKNRGQQGLMASGLDYPTIHRPARGSFLAFSDGRRQCLGKKFAQVLFTATMAIVLRSWEVDLVLEKGETRGMAENRARRALEESWATTTLQVREDVGLVLRRRA